MLPLIRIIEAAREKFHRKDCTCLFDRKKNYNEKKLTSHLPAILCVFIVFV